MAVEQRRADAEFPAEQAHFVLVERCQRLHNPPGFDGFRIPGDAVVMGFDKVRFS